MYYLAEKIMNTRLPDSFTRNAVSADGASLKVGIYFLQNGKATLDELKDKYEFIKDRRGAGFMQALELDRPCAPVIAKAQENGLLIISAGADIIRMVPPLVIEEGDIRDMKERLDKALSES